ncbi:SRPBCC family protein [Streptomyces sp. DSM 44915]|uniref:SRPBCC family protein n=2 Tax=Streptomyces chisholmiae TaxID=3075540 RepID=A0ABU2JJP0_9ACTN|nr:SRPBCC family protein [Streptomyces sp. DSM 44915]MDT0265132.1 SRPBCC family protein [Streptomyces sp. DSM 44915]
MAELLDEINAVHRAVGRRDIPAGASTTVLLSRRYDATLEDVWNACTTPERVARWLTPVTGDLRPGGSYQLTGNAHGEILLCERPTLLRVTWVFGEDITPADVSEVTLRLSPQEYGATLFELEHAAVGDPAFWERYGPGAAGVGWDLSLLGLSWHLAGTGPADPESWAAAAEGREFVVNTSQRWRAAHVAFGAPPDVAQRAAAQTTAFYTGES